jgi:hypothetical protein
MLPQRIDKRELRGKPKIRSTAHRDWVRGHMCCVPGCHEMPIEVAHVNRASTRGMGEKSSDAQTCSLCRDHHSESHRGEKTFEAKYGLDLMGLAREFYQRSPHRSKLDDPYVSR